MRTLATWQRSQRFNPTTFGVLSNPYFLTRRALSRAIANVAPKLNGRILDIGCGEKPYESYFASDTYYGVDVRSSEPNPHYRADVIYDGTNLPFNDQCFDAIVCTEVIEHVPDPVTFLAEANRVLKSSGKLLLTTPFVWEEHEIPNDYSRFSSFGLRHLARISGFEVEILVKTLPNLAAIAQLFGAAIFRLTRQRGFLLKKFSTPILIAPISLLGLAWDKFSSGDASFYLGNVVVLRKLANDPITSNEAPGT